MKTNLSTKTITGISLMALFIVGCSGGDQNSTRPSFQSPSSPRSFPLSGGTSSSVAPSAPAESNVSGNEEPAAPQTAAAENGNADIQEAIDAANAAAAAATQAAAASNNAASSADGAQTAGIVAAVLGGLGIAASVGGDYLVNKKSSERDTKTDSAVENAREAANKAFVGTAANNELLVDSRNADNMRDAEARARGLIAQLPGAQRSEFERKLDDAGDLDNVLAVIGEIETAVDDHREDEAKKLEDRKAQLRAQVESLEDGSREAFNTRIEAAKNFGDLLAISQNISTDLIRQDLADFKKSALDDVDTVKQAVDGLSSQLTALNTEAQKMTGKLEKATEAIGRASTKDQVEAALKSVTASVKSTWEAQIASFKSELQKQIEEASKRAGDAAKTAAGNAINGLKTELSSLKTAVEGLPATLGDDLSKQLQALESLNQIDSRLTNIEQKLKEAAAREVAAEEAPAPVEEKAPNQTIKTAEEVVQVVVVEGSDETQSADVAEQPEIKGDEGGSVTFR